MNIVAVDDRHKRNVIVDIAFPDLVAIARRKTAPFFREIEAACEDFDLDYDLFLNIYFSNLQTRSKCPHKRWPEVNGQPVFRIVIPNVEDAVAFHLKYHTGET